MKLSDGFVRDIPWYQQKFDYAGRTDGQPVYFGSAPIELTDDAAKWNIHYFQYDASNNVTSVLSKEGSWTNRAALFS